MHWIDAPRAGTQARKAVEGLCEARGFTRDAVASGATVVWSHRPASEELSEASWRRFGRDFGFRVGAHATPFWVIFRDRILIGILKRVLGE